MSIFKRLLPVVLGVLVLIAAQQSARAVVFDAVWDFEGGDDATQLSDKTGNGWNLTRENVGPLAATPIAATNGYSPAALGNNAFEWFGDFGVQDVPPTQGGFDTPAAMYAGGDYTFIAVIRPTTLNDGNGNNRHKTIIDPSGNVRFQHRPFNGGQTWVLDPGTALSGDQKPTFDNWSILMMTRSGNQSRILDNNSDAGNLFTLEATDNSSGSVPSTFRIGTQGGQNDAFHGQIAYLAFVNHSLDAAEQAEVLNMLNNPIPEPTSLTLLTVLGLCGLGCGRFRRRRQR